MRLDGGVRRLPNTVLEGHRFAVRPIARGEPLLSWGRPFGAALGPIAPGECLCNASVLAALADRRLGAALPARPNFADPPLAFAFDEAGFRPAPPNEPAADPLVFQGYRRPGGRGAGTRNYIVVLGTSSRTADVARSLAAKFRGAAAAFPGCDGVVAVAHTEGGGPGEPNNRAEILRALSGFVVHPNVGAVLAVDRGDEPVSNASLREHLLGAGRPLEAVPHRFLSVRGGLAAALAEGEAAVRAWLPRVAAEPRAPVPVSGLRVALQCGGSDAFSGVSGNPLAGAVAHEIVRHGGAANLCETDEAVGAEAYLLERVRDLETARRILGMIEAFKRRLAWHGVSPESNPSGGNRLRGLYNIVLKSLGATHKKDPRTRIDAAIAYAEPMAEPGFYFMDSPGNDLEGIAGQVGAGCNLIAFVTGNGSVTNFPFVPTIKITTTTRRHELLAREMDVNAGRYLDGEPMDALVRETFDLALATAAGRRTQGERAGHAQVSLWRDWRQTDGTRLGSIGARPAPAGRPLPLAPGGADPRLNLSFPAFRAESGWATERVGLVLPTSLCASQIAVMAAERLRAALGGNAAVSRFVALPHTEGCGFGGEPMYRLLLRTYRAYATHPNVAAALLLEHGCEKVPNDVMRRQFEAAGIPLERFGWASVQLDGGIERSLAGVEAWFAGRLAALAPPARVPADLGALTVGLLAASPLAEGAAAAFAAFARAVVAAGGSVVVPEADPLLEPGPFAAAVFGAAHPTPTLAYGQPIAEAGLHVAATETGHWAENLAGLGGSGAHLFLGAVGGGARQGHPLVPLIQVAEDGRREEIPAEDIDAFLPGDPEAGAALLARLVADVASGALIPRAVAEGALDFQLTRGLLGVST